jgi:hypothetical protein
MKRSRKRLALLLFMLCCVAATVRAQDEAEGGNPANWCRNGAFTRDSKEFGIARIKGEKGARAYFYGEDEGCPGPAAKCRQKAYVVPGDEVITSRTFGDWVCAWYQPARGSETVGWLAADRLDALESPAQPALAAWLGTWDFYRNEVRLSRGRRAGTLSVGGDATWEGAIPGNVHVGELSGEAEPAGGVLKLGADPEDCQATLRLVGPYLVVSDNKQCGGVNVTFDGVYRRKK